jgi:hypothetical protein
VFATREAFAVARRCPVIRREVTLGMQVSAPVGGSKQNARKTCSRFSQCYGENRFFAPSQGVCSAILALRLRCTPKGISMRGFEAAERMLCFECFVRYDHRLRNAAMGL